MGKPSKVSVDYHAWLRIETALPAVNYPVFPDGSNMLILFNRLNFQLVGALHQTRGAGLVQRGVNRLILLDFMLYQM